MEEFIRHITSGIPHDAIIALAAYFLGSWLRPIVAKIPSTNWVYRGVRVAHIILNKVDPDGNAKEDSKKGAEVDLTKLIPLLPLLLSITCTQMACTASFEEARLAGLQGSANKAQAETTDKITRDDAACQKLDNEHRWWGGAVVGSAVITGASGIATIPVQSDAGRITLASIGIVFAAGAAISKFEDSAVSSAWARQCSER